MFKHDFINEDMPQREVYAGDNLLYNEKFLCPYAETFGPKPRGYYTTAQRVDLTRLLPADISKIWPFRTNNCPLNGVLYIPKHEAKNTKKIPLVLFVHGKHNEFQNSALGYEYLCKSLSKEGFLTATIDMGFLNTFPEGEMQARAIMCLFHIRQFSFWNTDEAHPLYNKIDMDNIMLVGHSRGGEAICIANYFLKEQQGEILISGFSRTVLFNIRQLGAKISTLLAIAPTNISTILKQSHQVDHSLLVDNVHYFSLLGSGDCDVPLNSGISFFDKIHNESGNNLHCKGLVLLHDANHNNFNSFWAQADRRLNISNGHIINPLGQRATTKFFVKLVACGTLLKDNKSMQILSRNLIAPKNKWVGEENRTSPISQFQFQNRFRLFGQPEKSLIDTNKHNCFHIKFPDNFTINGQRSFIFNIGKFKNTTKPFYSEPEFDIFINNGMSPIALSANLTKIPLPDVWKGEYPLKIIVEQLKKHWSEFPQNVQNELNRISRVNSNENHIKTLLSNVLHTPECSIHIPGLCSPIVGQTFCWVLPEDIRGKSIANITFRFKDKEQYYSISNFHFSDVIYNDDFTNNMQRKSPSYN